MRRTSSSGGAFLPFFALAISLAVATPGLLAQTTSTIEGTVRDAQGLVLPDVEVRAASPVLATEVRVISDTAGVYRLAGLRPGVYTLTASRAGFATRVFKDIELALNRTLTFDITLEVGALEQTVTVEAELPLLKTTDSTAGDTIVPRQILDTPLNGRNYLDLMQLVPGVTINRHADEGSDTAVPVLGERGGNAIFLIDGMPNRDEAEGGPAAQFNQDTIYEFEVLTTGFKGEFGHGTGGIINVITKSGSNDWHGSAFLFHRNHVFDASNVPATDAPFLLRWDYGVTLGGPIAKDRVFFFGSAERIRESRQLNFVFPPGTPQIIRDSENRFNDSTRTYDTRLFAKLDEQLGRHRLSQQLNVTNAHLTDFLPLSLGTSLPSTRRSVDRRRTMLGFRDLATLGPSANPFVLEAYAQYRTEPTQIRPSHPEAGFQRTFFNIFSGFDTGGVFGDLGFVEFGAGFTPTELLQKYTSLGAKLAKHVGSHGWKWGFDYQRMKVNGNETNNLFNQLFATVADFETFGPIESGWYTLRSFTGLTPDANLIRLRNHYLGLFVQDDWRVHSTLTLNLGLRWDYDSKFPDKNNVSPRLGFAWSLTPKTVVRGSWAMFFDHFRLGLARDVPGFGGASIFFTQPFTYPRLFYGVPTIAPIIRGLCLSGTMTDAEIAATGATCPFGTQFPFYGVDHLNCVVAPGFPCIPADTPVTLSNVQQLTGLTPQQFLDQASLAISQPPGYFFWGLFGHLSQEFELDQFFPVQVDASFATPYSRSFNLGVQHQLARDWVVSVDYFHKDIRNILGIRRSNLAFEARIPGNEGMLQPGTGSVPINLFGPWHDGRYDAVIVSFNKRFSRRFALSGHYTYTDAVDNMRCPDFTSNVLITDGFFCTPSDSFIGVPTVVTDPISGQTNASGSFTASNGNPVPQAGKFYNGPDYEKGPSDLALDHTFLLHGLVEFPAGFQVSAIFRAQSGFHFSRLDDFPLDVDGDSIFWGVDVEAGRNAFKAPKYANLDIRFSKRFQVGERVTLTALFEFFNLFNARNPAAVETAEGRPTPFGQPLQVLPGREGQVGLRIEF